MFVAERLKQIVATREVQAEVVAPVPWFPLRSRRFGQYATFARVPHDALHDGVVVSHPRFVAIPKFGMSLSPYLMALGVKHVVEAINRRRPFDLIDAHYLYPDGVAATMLGRWLRKPVVLTARGSDVNVVAQHWWPRRLIVRATRDARRVITVSDALRAELVRLGASDSKISVLRNGVDLDRFRPTTDERERAGRKRLLIVSHLKEGKGHRAVIDAMARLPEFELVIVGDGPLRTELQARANAISAGNRIEFAGHVSHAELPRHYGAADALVLASDREGLPNVVLESLACGTPVIATAVGGIPEILTDSTAGVLMISASSASVVAAVTELFGRYPARAAVRATAERFGWEATVRGQLDVFRTAAQPRANR